MHYFFLDESYPPPTSGCKKIAMAAWAVEQRKWGRHTPQRFHLFKPPLLERICSMFETLGGQAIAATATLDESLYRAGETDSTNDIPSMARPDLIWSMSATFVLGVLVLEIFKHNHEIGTIDVHFDPKSLNSAHSVAWQKTLRELVVRQAKQFGSERGLRHFAKLGIRRITAVTKPDVGKAPDKFQVGTWVADKLCSHIDKVEVLEKCRHISVLDMSEAVRRTTQQFDGKSFDES